MIRTITEYKNYFQSMATTMGMDFVYGGSERILNRQNMDIRYPCLWLGIPEVKRKHDGGIKKKVFDGWFIVLDDAPTDDYAEQDNIVDLMEQKTEAILVQMQDDSMANQFEFDIEDATSYYRGRQTADDAWGWFTEFNLMGLHASGTDCL